jgi:hypothetical protein
MGMDDFARAAAFRVWLEDALAGALATWTGGTVVLDPAAPDVWDSNHLRLERPWDEPPERFPAAVEDAARAFGLRTPVVAIADPAQVTQLGAALRAAGYVRDGFVFMASRTHPGRPEDVVEGLDWRWSLCSCPPDRTWQGATVGGPGARTTVRRGDPRRVTRRDPGGAVRSATATRVLPRPPSRGSGAPMGRRFPR